MLLDGRSPDHCLSIAIKNLDVAESRILAAIIEDPSMFAPLFVSPLSVSLLTLLPCLSS